MVGWQITHRIEQKLVRENRKHAFRSQRQQREAPALELDDTKLNVGMDEKLEESKYNDLTDGRYEKTIYVKTWEGKTITVEISLEQTMEIAKRQIEAKTRIPKDHQHLVHKGKVLMDNTTLKEYGLSGGETVEMTALLLGGMKHKSLSPTPMDADREKKEKNPNRILMLAGSKMKSHRQHLKKKRLQQKS